jgi:adenylosuccinate synthase
MVDEAEILMQRKNENWVYEGAQGTLLDVVYGTIPYVTSSMPSSPPSDTGERVGVAKAYITRVGGGPMPTRMLPEEEQKVRGVKGETPGAEFGATTGRPRGCGWFDVVAARYAASIARIGKWDVTKLDRLTGFPRIKVAVAYRRKGSEIKMKSFPADRFVLEEIEPVYDELPGWEDDITQAKGPADLPQNARDYVKRIQDMVGCEISHVSFGPRAEQTITVE